MLLHGKLQAPSQEIFVHMERISISLENSSHKLTKAELSEFEKLFHLFESTGTLPSWLLLSAAPSITTPPSPVQQLKSFIGYSSNQAPNAVRQMLQNRSAKDFELIEFTQKETIIFEKLQTQMSLFAHPESFKKAFDQLKNAVNALFDNSSSPLKTQVQNASPVARIILRFTYKT